MLSSLCWKQNWKDWIHRHGHPDIYRPAVAPRMKGGKRSEDAVTPGCSHSVWLKNELHKIRKVQEVVARNFTVLMAD